MKTKKKNGKKIPEIEAAIEPDGIPQKERKHQDTQAKRRNIFKQRQLETESLLFVPSMRQVMRRSSLRERERGV